MFFVSQMFPFAPLLSVVIKLHPYARVTLSDPESRSIHPLDFFQLDARRAAKRPDCSKHSLDLIHRFQIADLPGVIDHGSRSFVTVVRLPGGPCLSLGVRFLFSYRYKRAVSLI